MLRVNTAPAATHRDVRWQALLPGVALVGVGFPDGPALSLVIVGRLMVFSAELNAQLAATGAITLKPVPIAVAVAALGICATAQGERRRRASARRALRAGLRLVEQKDECGPGRALPPMDVDALFGQPTVALRGPWNAPTSSRSGRPRTISRAGLYEYHLDFPGDALEPGCDYERWARRVTEGHEPTVYAHVATDPAHPGRLALQYWLFYAYNDWNNLHEGDWEMIQLVFDADDARAMRSRRAPTRSATASTKGPRRRTGAPTSSTSSTAPIRSCTRRPARTRTSSTKALFLGSSAEQGVGCDNTTGPHDDLRPDGRHDPERPGPGSRRVPLDRLPGPLGRAAAGVLQRPDGPEPEDAVDAADPVVGGLARPELHGPGRERVRHDRDRLLLPGDRQRVEGARAARPPSAPVHPGCSPRWPCCSSTRSRGRPGGRPRRSVSPAAAPGARRSRRRRACTWQAGPVPRHRASCSSRSRSSIALLQSLLLHGPAFSASRPAARPSGLLGFFVLAIGTALTLLGLGLVQAATARALVEIDQGRADRAPARLPARRRQHPAAARRAPLRSHRRLAARQLDLPDPDRGLAGGPLGADRAEHRAGTARRARRPAAQRPARTGRLAEGRVADRGRRGARDRRRPDRRRPADPRDERAVLARQRRRGPRLRRDDAARRDHDGVRLLDRSVSAALAEPATHGPPAEVEFSR